MPPLGEKRVNCPHRGCNYYAYQPHKVVTHLYRKHRISNEEFNEILRRGYPHGYNPLEFDKLVDRLVEMQLSECEWLPPVEKRQEERYQEIGSDEIG